MKLSLYYRSHLKILLIRVYHSENLTFKGFVCVLSYLTIFFLQNSDRYSLVKLTNYNCYIKGMRAETNLKLAFFLRCFIESFYFVRYKVVATSSCQKCLGWRCCNSCVRSVDCKSSQGLRCIFCWVALLGWLRGYQVLLRMWVHTVSHCLWSICENYTALSVAVWQVPTLAYSLKSTKTLLNRIDTQNWSLLGKQKKKTCDVVLMFRLWIHPLCFKYKLHSFPNGELLMGIGVTI